MDPSVLLKQLVETLVDMLKKLDLQYQLEILKVREGTDRGAARSWVLMATQNRLVRVQACCRCWAKNGEVGNMPPTYTV